MSLVNEDIFLGSNSKKIHLLHCSRFTLLTHVFQEGLRLTLTSRSLRIIKELDNEQIKQQNAYHNAAVTQKELIICPS